MVMKAIGNAWSRVRGSRVYRKLFVSQIDYNKVEEMKNEMMMKNRGMGLF